MNTTEFSRRVADDNGWSYDLAKQVVPPVVQGLRDVLAEGKSVRLRGVGIFDFIKKGGYTLKTTWTETNTTQMPVRYYIRFVPTEELKEEVKALDHSILEHQYDSPTEAEKEKKKKKKK